MKIAVCDDEIILYDAFKRIFHIKKRADFNYIF